MAVLLGGQPHKPIMTNGQIAKRASQAVATIRRIIEQDQRKGPQNFMVPAYCAAMDALDLAMALAKERFGYKASKLDDHLNVLLNVVWDLREDSHTFGYE